MLRQSNGLVRRNNTMAWEGGPRGSRVGCAAPAVRARVDRLRLRDSARRDSHRPKADTFPGLPARARRDLARGAVRRRLGRALGRLVGSCGKSATFITARLRKRLEGNISVSWEQTALVA